MSTPIRFPAEPQMTVDAALRLPALRRGAPEVLAGTDQLDRPVRWAHSCEARHVSELLEGDEMLLMTGMGLGGSASDQRAFVRDLVERRVAGLVIELGRVFQAMPAPLVQEARRLHLPLIALHEEVRFVEVTKQLHSAILTRQLAVERRGAELHDQLTAMLVDGAGVPSILGSIAHAIGNPVLLERAFGGVVFHAAHEASPEELLADWELLRPRVDGGAPLLAATAPVLASGGRIWGRLVAVPHERPVDGLARAAIERTAPLIALALGRSGEEQLLESRERGNFLHDVMTGRIAPEDIAARAARLDLPTPHHRLLGIVAARRDDAHASSPDERRAPVALRDVREALAVWGIASLLGTRSGAEDVVMLLALPRGMTRDTAVEHAVDALHAAGLDRPPPTIAAGPLADSWAELPDALRAADGTAETMRHGPARRWHDATVPDVERLLWGLRGDERLGAFARQRLRPVLDHDRGRTAVLLPTLQALCDHHWQKAPAARELGIQRQSLYARIGRLSQVLDADLEDPETRLGLDLAVRAQRIMPAPPLAE
ncbi:PucR family transcriptional regulator ligand-binding domain-containing protein [Paraconexibacter sp. AEG42_29]|uniref:PucR family transcriptional regulator n=1 Tax=Paraconexibacter sp. AEG42_29 TaxID=2997339 RepID=UPI00339D4865